MFLDLGSGVGIPSIYVALRFGVRTIGVERCPDLVPFNSPHLPELRICAVLCAQIGPQWFCDERISHIFALDARFGDKTLQNEYWVE